jgi:hypothetical protein
MTDEHILTFDTTVFLQLSHNDLAKARRAVNAYVCGQEIVRDLSLVSDNARTQLRKAHAQLNAVEEALPIRVKVFASGKLTLSILEQK